MITNKEAKFIKSLQLKKYRSRENAFIVEGEKNLLELVQSDLKFRDLFITNAFQEQLSGEDIDFKIVDEKSLIKAGSFQSNAAGLAIVEIPEYELSDMNSGQYLAFDDLRDPGNLGTIMRIADWYGIQDILCSESSVDVYNPKVIAASMGSFTRVRVHYVDLVETLSELKLPVYGTILDGESIHEFKFEKDCVFLFGNESQGISKPLFKCFDKGLTIPGYGGAESLNVAIATAVICDNFRRTL